MGAKLILKIKDILMCAALPAVLLFMGVFFDCSLCYAQDETVYLNAGGNVNREISVDPIDIPQFCMITPTDCQLLRRTPLLRRRTDSYGSAVTPD